jgi:hypothetical protein
MIRQIFRLRPVNSAGDTMRRNITIIGKIKKMTPVSGVVFFVGMF